MARRGNEPRRAENDDRRADGLLLPGFGIDPSRPDRLGGALDSRSSFRRFCGFSGTEPTPERTAFARFRKVLIAHGLDRLLFETVTAQLTAKAITVKTGTLVDATIIASASEEDGDARWVKHKGKAAVRGFRARVGAHADTAIVEEIAVTSANINVAWRTLIPSKRHRKILIPYDTAIYKHRNQIERCFGRFENFRRFATRYDRRVIHFSGCVHLAAVMIWPDHDRGFRLVVPFSNIGLDPVANPGFSGDRVLDWQFANAQRTTSREKL